MSKPPHITNKNKIPKSPGRRVIKSKAVNTKSQAVNTKGQLPVSYLYAYPSRWSTDTDASSSGTPEKPESNTKNQKLEIPPLLSKPKVPSENKTIEDKKPSAHIVDLCEDDRKRILQLIEELVKFKEETLSLNITVTKLNEELRDKKNEIIEITEKYTNKEREMLKQVECLQSTIKELSSKNDVLNQTHELEKQVLEYRIRELAASAKSYKVEKEHIQTKMSHHSQKLKIAISTIDRLTSELKALRLNKNQIDKASQVPEVKVDDCTSGLKMDPISDQQPPAHPCFVELLLCEMDPISDQQPPAHPSFVDSPEQKKMPVSNTLGDSNDRDNTLLSELFFMSSPFPWQLERLFFMQSPANCHDEAEVWETLPGNT